MRNIDIMKKCEKYIENNIDNTPTIQELANISGYSLYHFCHLFRAHFGLSVGKYLSNRKLAQAAKDIINGKSITEIAINTGYDTPSGFTKAFKKVYGLSPLQYKKLYVLRKDFIMIPQFLEKDNFTILAYSIKPKELEISPKENCAYWSTIDFKQYPPYPSNLVDKAEVAIWLHSEENIDTLTYYFGFETDIDKDYEGFIKIEIPKANYAVFEIPVSVTDNTFLDEMKKTWKYIFDEWFDKSDKTYNEEKYCFEYYVKDKGYIYIPVK